MPIIMSANQDFSAWNSGAFGYYQPLLLVVCSLLYIMLFGMYLLLIISVGRSFCFPGFPAIVRMLSSGIEAQYRATFPSAGPFQLASYSLNLDAPWSTVSCPNTGIPLTFNFVHPLHMRSVQSVSRILLETASESVCSSIMAYLQPNQSTAENCIPDVVSYIVKS